MTSGESSADVVGVPAEDQLLGAVLLGGASRRFGSDKALAEVGGTTMGALVVSALRGAGIDPVVAVGGTAGADLDLVTVPDGRPGEGPLAALATVLRWARRGRVLLVPCDIPRLTSELVLSLAGASDALAPDERARTVVVATVGGRPRHSVAVWPAGWASRVRHLVDGGERRFRKALDLGPWVGVEVPADLVEDADTVAELRRLVGDDEPA